MWDGTTTFCVWQRPPIRQTIWMPTFSPDVQAWFRLPKVKMRGPGATSIFVYFREFSEFRSVDTNNAGQIELLLGRLTPHAEGAWIQRTKPQLRD